MKDKAWWTAQLQRLTGLAIQYKYVLLVILAGVVLLLLPGGGEQEKPAAQVQSEPSVEQEFDLAQTEQRLAQALSKIDGAGEVTVVLTLAGSSRQVLAQDSNSSWQEGGQEESRTTVVISHGGGIESVYSNLAELPTVTVGQSVAQGDTIGSVGTTALAEAGEVYHLHFAMRADGQSVDPAEYLPKF